MDSWALVKRFRVRREVLMVTVLELMVDSSSIEVKLASEEVLESGDGREEWVGEASEEGFMVWQNKERKVESEKERGLLIYVS